MYPTYAVLYVVVLGSKLSGQSSVRKIKLTYLFNCLLLAKCNRPVSLKQIKIIIIRRLACNSPMQLDLKKFLNILQL